MKVGAERNGEEGRFRRKGREEWEVKEGKRDRRRERKVEGRKGDKREEREV